MAEALASSIVVQRTEVEASAIQQRDDPVAVQQRQMRCAGEQEEAF